MNNTINGRTPEEIKKGLECCKPVWVDDHWKTCDVKCPYIDDIGGFCRAKLIVDALALIQQLESAQPKWISVEDDLPAHVIAPCLICADGYVQVADWSHDKYELAWWFFVDGEYETGVTHWMPLPSTEGIE